MKVISLACIPRMPARPNTVFEIRTRFQTWNTTHASFPPPRAATRPSRRHFPQPSTFPRSFDTSPRALGGSRQKPANQHIRHVVKWAGPTCHSYCYLAPKSSPPARTRRALIGGSAIKRGNSNSIFEVNVFSALVYGSRATTVPAHVTPVDRESSPLFGCIRFGSFITWRRYRGT